MKMNMCTSLINIDTNFNSLNKDVRMFKLVC